MNFCFSIADVLICDVGLVVEGSKSDGRWQPEAASLPWRGTAAGGGYSTAGDLLKFGQALLDGTLLDPALLQQATAVQNHKHWYGYGFMVSGEGPARQFGHKGGAPGQNAVFWVLPEAGYVLVGLSNTDPDAMENAVNYIARRLPLRLQRGRKRKVHSDPGFSRVFLIALQARTPPQDMAILTAAQLRSNGVDFVLVEKTD